MAGIEFLLPLTSPLYFSNIYRDAAVTLFRESVLSLKPNPKKNWLKGQGLKCTYSITQAIGGSVKIS